MTFVDGVTFHTASLRWLVSNSTSNGDISINGTYEIALESESSENVRFSIPITGSIEYELQLRGLFVDVQYRYTISVLANDRSVQAAAQGTFRTLRYCKLNQ